jgi:toxin ParE1/3/4
MKLRYGTRAQYDIEEIHNYIAERDASAAARVVARLRFVSEQLLDRPRLGRVTNVDGIFVRSVAKYPYVIFYTLMPDEIVILHIRHTARRELDPSEMI